MNQTHTTHTPPRRRMSTSRHTRAHTHTHSFIHTPHISSHSHILAHSHIGDFPPIAVVTNCYKLGDLNQHRFIFWKFWRTEVPRRLTRPASHLETLWKLCGNSRRLFSCLFQLLEVPTVLLPSSHLQWQDRGFLITAPCPPPPPPALTGEDPRDDIGPPGEPLMARSALKNLYPTCSPKSCSPHNI